MTWRPVLLATVWVATSGCATTPLPPDLRRFEFAQPHMGTIFRVVLFAADSAGAAAAASEAFAVVHRLDSLLSDWDPSSELSRLGEVAGSAEGRGVSPEVCEVLSRARDWAERTGGAFDPTIGPLTRLWRWSARRGELPDPERLAAARAAVGWRHMRVEVAPDDGCVVWLDRPAMALDLGGIAKGWAADAALATLRRLGYASALVDAGGDIAVGAAPPGEDSWRVVVGGEAGGPPTSPERVLSLANVGVATSGARYRFVEVGGVRYSHVIDPRTGLGVTRPRAVTVIAPDATTADVLASAVSVLDAAAGRALVASVPGARVITLSMEPER